MPCPFCKQEHNFTVKEALRRLERGPKEVRAALKGATKAELNWAQPGRWSPRQVAFHLLDTELVYSTRFRKLLAQDGGELPAFDQNLWTANCTAGRDMAHALDTFDRLRRDNVAMLRAAAAEPATLDRAGRHPEYGMLTVRDVMLHLSPHDMNHAGQIRREREKYRASRGKRHVA